MKGLVLVLAISIVLVSSPEAFSQAEDVDLYVKSVMEKSHIPGVSLAVVQSGNVVLSRQYGLANVELDVPVGADSPFKIASLTKPITAIAVMMLVEEGKVSLDKPLAAHLPQLPSVWGDVTVRQALSHTSGLADYFQSPDWSWRNSWRLDLTYDEFIKMTEKTPVRSKPGEKMKYNNTGYYLLGMLLEKVSGRTYQQYLDQHIFKPLGMSHTRRDSSAAIVPHRVSGYTYANHRLYNTEYTSDTWAFSEGGIITTALDLAKLDNALYTEKLLKRSTLEQLWTPTKLNNGKPGVIGDNGAGKSNYYGLGWFISDYHNHKIILHGGDKPGFSCAYFRFVENDLTVIVLSNLSSGPMYEMAGAIGELYLKR